MNEDDVQESGIRDADIVAYDPRGKAILVAEVKGMSANENTLFQVLADLKAADPPIPFGLLVDPGRMVLFGRDMEDPDTPILERETATVLSHYEPDFSRKRIFSGYLRTLVESWILDLAQHWKSAVPPLSEDLAAIGLLQRLEGGTTRTEVELHGHPLR